MATEKQVNFIRQLCGTSIPIKGLCELEGVPSLHDLDKAIASSLISKLLDPEQKNALKDEVLTQNMDSLFD